MKPTRNRVYCNAIHRTKMLFESQEKADNFIRFNAGEIGEDDENEYVPIRSYYCPSCGGWHVTHHSETRKQQRIDNIQEAAYQLEKFIESLKQTYTNQEWKKWESQMETANEAVTLLEDQPSYHNFLLKVKRQLKHYKSMIVSAKLKEEKKLCKETHQMATKRHLVNCINSLMDGNRQSAIVSLTAADNRMKNMPISCEKIELMKLFMQIIQNSTLFEPKTVEQII